MIARGSHHQSKTVQIEQSSGWHSHLAQGLLIAAVVWTAWFPVETSPTTAVLLAALVLVLVEWAWARSERVWTWVRVAAASVLLLYLVLSAAGGWDPAAAISELALGAAIVAVLFLASRERSMPWFRCTFALGVAALSLWALWQVAFGFERDFAVISELPETVRSYAVIRLESGRAFASQIIPGHLGALLVTVLPLFVVDLRRRPWVSIVGVVLCVVGLYFTYSALGIALASGACVALLASRRGVAFRTVMIGLALFVVLVSGALVARPDLVDLEPLRLRIDNWKTALWLWSTSPMSGVGLGSYGQASQAVPFEVGNRPSHAHCLPLEWLAELGLVGLALFFVAASWLVSLIRDLWQERPGLAVAIAVIPLHNLADFSLYSSGVAIPWALLTGWAVALKRSAEPCPAPARARPVVVAAAALVLAVVCLHSTSVMLERAYSSLDDPAAAHAAAMRSHQLAPWRVGPVALAAAAALESGDPTAIAATYEIMVSSRWLRPQSTSLADSRRRVSAVNGMVSDAMAEGWAAAHTQGRNEVFADELDHFLGEIEALGNGDSS